MVETGRFSIIPINHVGIPDYCRKFRVTVATLGPLIDIRGTDDSKPIVNDADLYYNVRQ